MTSKAPAIPMTMSGFCAFPSADSHKHCVNSTCQCTCHGPRAALPFRARQIVRDDQGNHFLYVSRASNGKHLVESVATRERMYVPDGQIVASNREAF